jgi:hypothetical protein
MGSNRMFVTSAITAIMLASAALAKTFMVTTAIAGAESMQTTTCCTAECAKKCDSALAMQKKLPGIRLR